MSIYNTSHSRRAGMARSPNTQQLGNMPPRIMKRRPPQSAAQHQPINVPYNDFQLMSCKKRGKSHVMDFKTNKPVDFKNFARPVKLQRKENNSHPYGRMPHRMANGDNTLNAGQGGAQVGASGSSSSSSHDPSAAAGAASSLSSGPHQQQHGPRTGADTSLIAPLGGATRNKQMLFKKRTKQIFLAKEDARELKEQEHKPWLLEDYDGQNTYTGSYEGSQRSDYVFFVVSGNDFKVVPVDRWYKFQQKRNFATLSLEEAEEQLKAQQKREQGRWMMLNRNKTMADTDAQTQSAPGSKVNFKKTDHGDAATGDSDDEGRSRRRSRHDSDIDDLDFDDVFQDDEEGGGEHEFEDEDARESKERLKRETKGYAPGGDEEEGDTNTREESNQLTSEGKQIRKLVRTLEKNGAYESDEDRDPYASSEDEMESDAEKEETKSEAENSQQKKTAVPLKKKGPIPSSKGIAVKKSQASKIKKEGLSRPIGRPGSPSLQQGKGSVSPPPAQRATSPTQQRMREISPGASKKRKPDEGDYASDVKRQRGSTAPSMSSAAAGAPSPVTGGDDSLITEQEVIETLRGKKMTTKEFLMHFRKRIKKNEKNREIVTGLLKKVARHNTSDEDPKKRVLELRPELQ